MCFMSCIHQLTYTLTHRGSYRDKRKGTFHYLEGVNTNLSCVVLFLVKGSGKWERGNFDHTVTLLQDRLSYSFFTLKSQNRDVT